jgi:hypothetical protein
VIVRKLTAFIGINLVIAAAASLAPPSLTNEQEYRNVAIVHEFVESVTSVEPLNIILGDSRSDCCIAARELGFVDLSYQGASPVEGYYILRRLIERDVPLGEVLLSYGPFHIFTQDTFHAQTRYFGIIDREYAGRVLDQAIELGDAEYLDYQWKALEVIDDSLPWLPDSAKIRLVNVLSIDESIEALIEEFRARLSAGGSAFAGEDVSPGSERLYEMDAVGWVNTVDELSPEAEKPSAVSPINEIYLKEIVELAHSENLKVGFVVMPFNKDVQHPAREYYDRYFALLRRAGLGACTGQEYWWPNELFADGHHLNADGAHKFSKTLAHHLQFCGG